MGHYVINGEVIDVREDHPTPLDLKRAAGVPTDNWVWATMPSGQRLNLPDTELLPAGARDFSITPHFKYGC